MFQDVKRAAETIKYNNPLRKHVETILEKVRPYHIIINFQIPWNAILLSWFR